MNELLLERYEVLEAVGKGAFSQVAKAFDKKIERYVAIKAIPINNKTAIMALREVKTVASLNHPGIVTLYEFEQTDKNYYLIMEFVAGKTLAELLAAAKTLSVDVAVAIIMQACQAIAYAHEHGIIHRDLKPSNIMILPDGRLKIMDFGVAHLRRFNAEYEVKQTVGTFAYMSPEQALGEEVKESSDIFSLGVLLYRLVTGQLPFSGKTPAQIVYSLFNKEPREPKELNQQISVSLNQIILTALSKNPDQRFTSAQEFAAHLSPLLEDEPAKLVASYLQEVFILQPSESSKGFKETLLSWQQKYQDFFVRLLAATLTSLITLPGLNWLSVTNELKLLLLPFIFALFLLLPPAGLGLAFTLLTYSLFKFSFSLGILAAIFFVSYFFILGRAFPLLATLPFAAPLLANWQLSFFLPLAVGLSFTPLLAALLTAISFLLTYTAQLLNIAQISWLPLIKPLPTSTFKASGYEMFVTLSQNIKAHPEVGWQLLIWLVGSVFISLSRRVQKSLVRRLLALLAGTSVIGVATLTFLKSNQLKLNLFLQNLTFSFIILAVILIVFTPNKE